LEGCFWGRQPAFSLRLEAFKIALPNTGVSQISPKKLRKNLKLRTRFKN
jgi:hypothetical protein